MIKAIFKRAAIAFFVAMTAPGIAQETKPLAPDTIPVSNDYVLRNWGVYDGLPSNSINGIAQTPDGYLWVATRHGLARFDGLRFTSFFKKDTPGLESDFIKSAFAARDGSLWGGLGRGGVVRLSEGHFQPIISPLPATEQTQWTSSFAEDAEGGVWFGYAPDLKLLRWKDGKLTSFSSEDGVGPGIDTYVYADVKGAIWFSTTNGCGIFDGRRFQRIDEAGTNAWIHTTPSREGGMWATNGSLLLRYEADGKRETIADLGTIQVRLLYEDRSGDLWLAINGIGVLRYHEGGFVRVPTSHTNISSIMEDREGNLWLGTNGGGLDRLSSRAFSLHRSESGLLNDSVTTLCQDSEGRLWLVGIGGIPVRAIDSTNRSFSVIPNWPGDLVMTISAGSPGEVWFATAGALKRWHEGAFNTETLDQGSTALLLDREGNLWVSIINGQLVCHFPEGGNTFIPQDGGLVQPRALAEDSSGRIWVGTEAGLIFERQKDRFAPIPLPGGGEIGQIRFIVPDVNDTVWIGADSGGLYRWRAGQVTHLSSDAGLPSDDFRIMTIEPDGDFWFGTGRGLFRVKRDELEAVFDGTLPSLHATSYGRNDGMPSVDFSFGFRNAVTRTPDGHLWFATYSGALEVDPQKLKEESPRASVLVEEIQVGGKTLGSNGQAKLSIPPNPGPLQIQYTLPEMSVPEQIRFRYRLVGLGNEEWVEAGSQRVAAFANLPPGAYRFEVAAAVAEGPWLPALGTLPFSIQAAWWQTSLFRIGALIVVFLAVAWVARAIELRRVRARMRQLEQDHALERERTRIARDIHDELGANLTHISIASHLAQLEPPDVASHHLQEVTAITRKTIKLLGEIVWAVNPHRDTLDSLVHYINQYAMNLLSAAGIACEADIPEKVPDYPVTAEARHHLFLVVKEALNNLVKYAGAKVVKLKIENVDNRLRIVIADDGCGFDLGSTREGSNGLRNMRERLSEIGGECRVESFLGQGTRVTLEFPLRAAPKPGA